MPTISAIPHATLPYVRVTISWVDYPAVVYARVIRTVVATGESTPLRPYIAYNGDYILLACGQAIFWDTELPVDTDVTYTTEAFEGPCTANPVTCLPCIPVTATTGVVSVASGGSFFLGDPVRPCRDQAVPLCFVSPTNPECVPGQGIFFASMDDESEEPNSLTVNPTNRRNPISISRERRGIASILTLVTRTFDDRDAVKLLTRPGSPLLWRGPASYGIADTYMDVGEVTVSRGLSDHRIQPRVVTLPFATVDRPAGPSTGICGARVMDLCDTYATWDDMEAEGLQWQALLLGLGSGPVPGLRTWNAVLAEFADWNDVDDGTRDWDDLQAGS